MKAITNISQLVTCTPTNGILIAKRGQELGDVGCIENGAVLIEQGLIRQVGTAYSLSHDISALPPENVFDAGGRVVMPGFVDSHTHALFVGHRAAEFALRVQGKSYMEILQAGGGILNSRKALEEASDEQILAETKKRLYRMLQYGTTTVEIKSGYGLNTEQELRSLELIARLKEQVPIDIHATFMGAHAVPPEYKNSKKDFVNLVANEMIPVVGRRKMAEFCDVFCEEEVFSLVETDQIFRSAVDHGLRLRLHADEIVSIGGTELACQFGAMSADHLIAITNSGIQALANSQTIANLLPGTCHSLMKPYAPARKMIDAGVAIALSTDCNPGSCYTESMPMIISLACVNLRLSPEEAINAATFNGACALGCQEHRGSIELGKKADLIILDYVDYRELPYHFGIQPVYKTMKNGEFIDFSQ